MEIAGIQIAVIVVTISIIIAGIMMGLGRALGYKSVERFGVEELFQSILNAAIVGGAVILVEAIKTLASTIVTPACSTGADAIAELGCILNLASVSTFTLLQEILKMMNVVGYYQTLVLNFGSFSIQPFVNLNGISGILASQALSLNITLILINLNAQIITFFSQSALALFFPLGLILRSFFATRKVGGFLIGVAIGLYILYPAFVLAFPIPDLTNETAQIANFNKNPYYATMPILDLNGNGAIASKMDNMSTRMNSTINIVINETSSTNQTYIADLSGDLTLISQTNANAISKLLLYAVFAPIFSLIVTLVFIKEMASVLGGEISFKSEVI